MQNTRQVFEDRFLLTVIYSHDQVTTDSALTHALQQTTSGFKYFNISLHFRLWARKYSWGYLNPNDLMSLGDSKAGDRIFRIYNLELLLWSCRGRKYWSVWDRYYNEAIWQLYWRDAVSTTGPTKRVDRIFGCGIVDWKYYYSSQKLVQLQKNWWLHFFKINHFL